MHPPVPFLERLDAIAREQLLAVARPVALAKGARLLRHGDPARGAYLLRAGRAEALVTLPGGEALVVAGFGPGAVLGEMSLIERGTCTATVLAAEPLEGWFIEREDFRALVAQRAATALHIQHALILTLSDKLRALNARLLEVPAAEDHPSPRRPREPDPLARARRLERPSFDCRPFLPLLPVFEGFDPAEIEEVLRHGAFLELPRGHGVFHADEPSHACFIVIRGAVEIRAHHAERERRIAVLGPGQLLGYMSALERGVHGSDAIVREDAALLEIPAPAFDALYTASGPVSGRLHRAIQRSLLFSLGQTNRHLTRLISLARLRGADREGRALESARGEQIVSSPQD